MLGRPSCNDYWERHVLVTDSMHKFGLRAANTFCFPGEALQTMIAWGKTREEGVQIDYLFVSRTLFGDAGASDRKFSDQITLLYGALGSCVIFQC